MLAVEVVTEDEKDNAGVDVGVEFVLRILLIASICDTADRYDAADLRLIFDFFLPENMEGVGDGGLMAIGEGIVSSEDAALNDDDGR